MKSIQNSAYALCFLFVAVACGGSDDESSENENQSTGGMSGNNSDEIDERCSLSHCPNDARAYNSAECEVYVMSPCFSAWQEDMACFRANETCDPDGTANTDSIRTCAENLKFNACAEAMIGGS